jgi:hypothetical protein
MEKPVAVIIKDIRSLPKKTPVHFHATGRKNANYARPTRRMFFPGGNDSGINGQIVLVFNRAGKTQTK